MKKISPHFFQMLLLDFGVDVGPPGLCWTLLVPIWPMVSWLERAARMVECHVPILTCILWLVLGRKLKETGHTKNS